MQRRIPSGTSGLGSARTGPRGEHCRRLHPDQNPFPTNRVYYWVGYGRALTRLRGRHDDAVRALRRAETIYPLRVQRNPFVREALGELLTRSRRDATGRELRGMTYRAGLPV